MYILSTLINIDQQWYHVTDIYCKWQSSIYHPQLVTEVCRSGKANVGSWWWVVAQEDLNWRWPCMHGSPRKGYRESVARFVSMINMYQNVIVWLMFAGLKWLTQHGNSAGIWNSAGRWFVIVLFLLPFLRRLYPAVVREVFSEWRVEYSGRTNVFIDQPVGSLCKCLWILGSYQFHISKNCKTCLDTDMAKTAKIEKACHVEIQILVRTAKAESILVGFIVSRVSIHVNADRSNF